MEDTFSLEMQHKYEVRCFTAHLLGVRRKNRGVKDTINSRISLFDTNFLEKMERLPRTSTNTVHGDAHIISTMKRVIKSKTILK